MAEPQSNESQSLEEQYSLEKPDTASKPEEAKEAESPVTADSEGTGETPAAVQETAEEKPSAVEESSEAAPAATEEISEAAEEEAQDVVETREIKLETAPVDFRFPTTNQTRHCFTRYIEYHRCVAAKGDDTTECDKFAKYYRSLCPTEWVERWNEQRENGTFPGPL